MERLILAVGLLLVALVVAWVLNRRRSDAPTSGGWTVPAQLDRADFDRPDVAWLVVVFSSGSCSSCEEVVETATVLASDEVAVIDAEVGRHKDLHDRYRIDAVPTLVIADGDGVVKASFIGPVKAADLWGTMAELREPGSVP